MEKHAIVLNINKNEIKYRHPSRSSKNKLSILLSLVILIVILPICNINVRQSMLRVYNPVSSLYNDNSKAIFTFAQSKNWNDFALPLVTSEVEIDNGNVYLTATNSIMVNSIEDGVIEDCGTSNDGVRYIKISHTSEIMSVIINVDIIGVEVGEVVRRGQNMATVRIGQKITLQIFQGENQIKELTLNQSKLVWKK